MCSITNTVIPSDSTLKFQWIVFSVSRPPSWNLEPSASKEFDHNRQKYLPESKLRPRLFPLVGAAPGTGQWCGRNPADRRQMPTVVIPSETLPWQPASGRFASERLNVALYKWAIEWSLKTPTFVARIERNIRHFCLELPGIQNLR